MKYILIFFVKVYRKLISPLLVNTCRYTPSCSAYAIESLKRHGAVKGALLTFKRLLRCNHFSKGGFDPVPDNLKGDIKWLL